MKGVPTAHRIIDSACLLAGRFSSYGRVTKPVFIVGSGRSGSSLLSRVMRSHSGLCTFPNEANRWWHPRLYPFSKASVSSLPYVSDPSEFSSISLASWPVGHAESIRRLFSGFCLLRGNRQPFVLKSAMISFMVPTILELFPDARFIHLYRNGLSVAASLAEKEWGGHSEFFSNKSEFELQCARYWDACMKEMARVDTECGLSEKEAFVEMSYEEFCNNPASSLAVLSDFLDCDAEGFTYPIASISSTNFKAGDRSGPHWDEVWSVVKETAESRGYGCPS